MSAFVHEWNDSANLGQVPEFVDETWSASAPRVLAPTAQEALSVHLGRIEAFGVVLAAGAQPGGTPRAWQGCEASSLPGEELPRGTARDVRIGTSDAGPVLETVRAWVDAGESVGVMLSTEELARVEFWARLGLDRVVLEAPEGLSLADVRSAVTVARAQLPTSMQLGYRGRNDHGLGVARALVALESGAPLIYGTFLGVGPQGAHVPLDQVMVNAYLAEALGAHRNLQGLVPCLEDLAAALDWPIPPNYPLVGRDAFRTATGVHAAAIVKALARGDADLADRVYSGVPAGAFGKSQSIELGPMSGMSNVRYWLERAGEPDDEALAEALFARAKGSDRVLSSAEIADVIAKYRRPRLDAEAKVGGLAAAARESGQSRNED
ncbi:MAG: hypothetical protein AAFZ18_21555 [Myxococcota bacterium]